MSDRNVYGPDRPSARYRDAGLTDPANYPPGRDGRMPSPTLEERMHRALEFRAFLARWRGGPPSTGAARVHGLEP